jgi:hypothetical protein
VGGPFGWPVFAGRGWMLPGCRPRRTSRKLRHLTGVGCSAVPAHGAEGFDFLGFQQHKVESWRWRGRWYLQRWPSSRAMLSVRAKIRSLTDRKLVGWPIEAIVPSSTAACGVGRLLPPRQLGAEVRRDRPLRPRAFGDLGQCEARPPRTELATPPHGGVAGPPRRLSPQRNGALRDCACLAVNEVGKPGAGEPHARFDRGSLLKRQPR